MARILVVDDEPIIAMTMCDWIIDLGHEALGPAGNLASAVSLAELELDAAILDVSLGAQTTIAVARRLAERGVPVAVASGHDAGSIDPAYDKRLLLPKPFGFESFRRTVERLLAAAAERRHSETG